MQYVALAEKGAEAVRDIAAFARANPGQAALNKLTLYQAAKELGSDFRMVRRYYRKARGRFRAARRRVGRPKRTMRSAYGSRKRRKRTTYKRRMQPHAKVGKSATEVDYNAVIDFGEQNVGPWKVGTGNSTLTAPGTRLRPWTWVNGMRICIRCQNESFIPMEYHWCLVQLREPSAGTPAGGVNAFDTDWFRDNRSGQVDVLTDFTTNSPNAGVWSQFLSCGRIATSRYKVITHRKVLLAGKAGNGSQENIGFKGNGHIYHCEKYIKMKKRVLFNAITDVTGRYPVYFVDWCTTPTQTDYPAGGTSAARRFCQMTTYFDAF